MHHLPSCFRTGNATKAKTFITMFIKSTRGQNSLSLKDFFPPSQEARHGLPLHVCIILPSSSSASATSAASTYAQQQPATSLLLDVDDRWQHLSEVLCSSPSPECFFLLSSFFPFLPSILPFVLPPFVLGFNGKADHGSLFFAKERGWYVVAAVHVGCKHW